jgi:hypothetical protein
LQRFMDRAKISIKPVKICYKKRIRLPLLRKLSSVSIQSEPHRHKAHIEIQICYVYPYVSMILCGSNNFKVRYYSIS